MTDTSKLARFRTGGMLATTLVGLACSAGDTAIGPEPPRGALDPTSLDATMKATGSTLQAVVLTPSTASVAPGATQQFAASGRMSNGSTAPVTVTWSAVGGSISPTGLFKAGQTAGTYRVLATAAGGKADTATITVTALALTGGCDIDKSALQFGGFFEGTAPFSRWSVNEADATPHSHTKSTSVYRNCGGSARIEVWKSDPLEAGSYRSELKISKDTANGGVAVPSGYSVVGHLGTEMWMGWSIYVPADFVFETAANAQETVTQVAPGGGHSPTWEMQIDRGTFRAVSRTGGSASCCTTIIAGTRPIAKGAWHDFVLHAKWKSDNTGILEMWMNGTKFVDRRNVPTAYSDWGTSGLTPYLKMGIYKWSWKYTTSIVTKRVLYFDAVRITDGAHGSYSVVAPR